MHAERGAARATAVLSLSAPGHSLDRREARIPREHACWEASSCATAHAASQAQAFAMHAGMSQRARMRAERVWTRCERPQQTETYTWYRPGPPWVPQPLVDMLSRALGAVPIVMHGIWGTPMPHRVPMAVVIGKALQVRRPLHVLQRPLNACGRGCGWKIVLYAISVCGLCRGLSQCVVPCNLTLSEPCAPLCLGAKHAPLCTLPLLLFQVPDGMIPAAPSPAAAAAAAVCCTAAHSTHSAGTPFVACWLQVPHIAQPSEEQVREQLERFIASMRDLYERYKGRFGHADVPLVVL